MSVYTHVRCPVCGCRWDEHPADTVCAVYRPTLERPPDPASVRDAAAVIRANEPREEVSRGSA